MTWSDAPSPTVQRAAPARRAPARWPAPAEFGPAWPAARLDGAAAARQVPVAAARRRTTRCSRTWDERPAAGRRRRTGRWRRTCRIRFTFTDGGPDLRFVDQRTFGAHALVATAARTPRADRAHRPRPVRARLRPGRVRGPALRTPAHRGQAGAAGPVADLRRRQHLRRRGAVAGPAALGPAHRDAEPPGGRRLLAAVREVLGEALAAGRHLASTPSTSTSTGRAATSTGRSPSTAGRAGLPPLRHAGPAGPVHEPLVLQLPALPAPPPPRPALTQRALTRRGSDATGSDTTGSGTPLDQGVPLRPVNAVR